MSKRPSAWELIIQSTQFLCKNIRMGVYYATPLLIPIVAIETISTFGGYKFDAIENIQLINAYFYTCFALMWHRAFLLGPKTEHKINQFRPHQGDKKFIFLFLSLGAIPFLYALAAIVILEILVEYSVSLTLPITGIITLAVFIIIKIARYSYNLPAWATGAFTPLKQGHQISRGLLFPFITACGITTLLLIIISTIPSMFLYAPIFTSPDRLQNIANHGYSLSETATLFFIQDLPWIPVNFCVIALNVGILSRLYQWATQDSTN